jgi:hypothetical protein
MAGFDTKSISVVEPGHKQYEHLDVMDTPGSRHASTRFYNEVVSAYNQCKVGAIMIVPVPEGIKYYNLKNVLLGRDLEPGVDVKVARQETGPDGVLLPRSERPAKIKKLTSKKGRIIDSRLPEVHDD